MHWVERDGLRVPVRLSGHAALDLCNTYAGWGEPPRVAGDWLKTYEHLVVWSKYAELLTPGEMTRLRRHRASTAAPAVLADVRRLRNLLHAAVLAPNDRRAVAGVNGFVRRAARELRLQPGRPPQLEVSTTAGLALPLLRAAWAAADLLTSGRLDEIGACPGAGCGWMFLDPSGRRRWCSMSSCGNRAKVRAYALRQR